MLDHVKDESNEQLEHELDHLKDMFNRMHTKAGAELNSPFGTGTVIRLILHFKMNVINLE